MAKKKATKRATAAAVAGAADGSAFPARIVLGTGYPWAMGTGPEYHQISLGKSPLGFSPQKLKWLRKLWAKDVPKYRLVLELVKTPNDKDEGRRTLDLANTTNTL